mgnify:FL=1
MTLYSGYIFFACLAAACIPAIALGIAERPVRNYALAASLFFVTAALANHPVQLAYFVAYFIWQFITVMSYMHIYRKRGRDSRIYHAMLIISLLPLALQKLSALTDTSIFGFIGISYLSFKTLQMIIEIYDGLIDEVKPLDFARFMIFFPVFSSGPIDRSRRFNDDSHRMIQRSEYLDLLGSGIFRILLGLVYKLVISSYLFALLSLISGMREWYFYVAYAYVYGLYIFFDFAGYSLMAVGTSYIFGVRTPDNFKAPFAAVDISDFWNRWHITLSHWFRDYLFSRIVMAFTKKKLLDTRLQRACTAFIINMTVMGAWHGLTPYYLLYGLYHGLLLAASEVYHKKSQFYKKYKRSKLYRTVSCFVTIQAVMFGFLIFSGHLFTHS